VLEATVSRWLNRKERVEVARHGQLETDKVNVKSAPSGRRYGEDPGAARGYVRVGEVLDD
jgi:hypothetical protein